MYEVREDADQFGAPVRVLEEKAGLPFVIVRLSCDVHRWTLIPFFAVREIIDSECPENLVTLTFST
jgi:hypothetical protein